MNELDAFRGVVILDNRNAIVHIDPLYRNHAVTALWPDTAGHDLDAVIRRRQRMRRIAGMLRTLDRETPIAAGEGIILKRNAIHRHTVERRLVALG